MSPAILGSVKLNTADLILDLLPEVISETAAVGYMIAQVMTGKLSGFAESNDTGNVFRSCFFLLS